jgi:hypothetical protein
MQGKSEVRDDAPRDEPGADERFEHGLQRALATPPQKHKPSGEVQDLNRLIGEVQMLQEELSGLRSTSQADRSVRPRRQRRL